MRLWNVDPRLMCDRHLLGEHVEMHMTAGCVKRGKRLDGFLKGGLLDLSLVEVRHLRLAAEMAGRGFKHKSPLGSVFWRGKYEQGGVDVEANLVELRRRCDACRERISDALR